MKQKEEVDVLTGRDAEEEFVGHPRVNGDEQDIAWAGGEPDEDVRGWTMARKVDELDNCCLARASYICSVDTSHFSLLFSV